MKTVKINPLTIEGLYVNTEVRNETERFKNAYLHGEAERINGYDLIGIEGEIPNEGIYPATVYGINEACMLFVWNCNDSHRPKRGLVVLNSDAESMQYAIEQYMAKVDIL